MVVGIGELLWDRFPDGRRELGGAVANLAYHATRLGDRGVVASRVGRDAPGDDLAARLLELGVDCSHLQRDAEHPTGTVDVNLTPAGHPSYTIHERVAYDFPVLDRRWRQLAAGTDAVTFGTLAQRTATGAEVIASFLDACPPGCVRLLDVNLRQRFWSDRLLERSLRAATALKLNEEELPAVAAAAGVSGATADAVLRRLAERFDLRLACLTRGAGGCLLVADGDRVEHPGTRVPVADTVGAGDAFAAAVLHHLLRGSSLQRMAAAANDYAAFVATRRGGTPPVPGPVARRARAGEAP